MTTQTEMQDDTAQKLQPVDSTNRVEIMDILRGFALIGICLMNIEWFGRSITEIGRFDFSLEGVDWGAGWLVRLLVEGKFYKLFSVLFGMGFAVMLLQAQRKGRPFGAWFSRRMALLFAIGSLHFLFIWDGDILRDYAISGFFLLGWIYLLRVKKMRWADKPVNFLRIGLGFLLLPFIVATFAGSYFGTTRTDDVMLKDHQLEVAVEARVAQIKQDESLAAPLKQIAVEEKAGTREKPEVETDDMADDELIIHKSERRFISRHKRELEKQEEFAAMKGDSYWATVTHRAGTYFDELKKAPFFALFMCLPMFMVGYWFVASGVIANIKQNTVLFKGMAWVGTGVGLMLGVAGLAGMAHPETKNIIEFEVASNLIFALSQLFLTAGYIGLFAMMSLTIRGEKLIGWLKPLGRMALTNYITQSLVLGLIFYGYAGGMYGELLRATQVLIVLALIIVQAIVSHIWLRHFKFGPLEWVWRSLTYMQWQSIKLEPKQDKVKQQVIA